MSLFTANKLLYRKPRESAREFSKSLVTNPIYKNQIHFYTQETIINAILKVVFAVTKTPVCYLWINLMRVCIIYGENENLT